MEPRVRCKIDVVVGPGGLVRLHLHQFQVNQSETAARDRLNGQQQQCSGAKKEDVGWNPNPDGKEERLPRKQEELRAKDNLRMEGEFSQREARTWNPGEKVEPFWRRDNLAMEGEFCRREDVLLQDENLRRSSTRRHVGTMEEGRLGVWDQGERVAKVVRPDNLSLR